MKNIFLCLITGVILSTLAPPVVADKTMPTSSFFDAAICQPPYSSKHASEIYDAAEKLGKPIRLSGAAIYHLPTPLKRDGFVAHDVVFASSTIGVLIEGNVAEKLAKHYDLAPEKLNIINMSGFARQLPDDEQNLIELGLISIVALKSNVFKDKTLLACQFVSNQDRENMKYMNKN